MCKFVLKNRCTGKTDELLQILIDDPEAVLVVRNKRTVVNMQERLKYRGVGSADASDRVVSVNMLRTTSGKWKNPKFLIDDVSWLLADILGKRPEVIADTPDELVVDLTSQV